MVAAQAGDRTAYETLLRDCIPFIQRVARGQGVPSDFVDDVVQDPSAAIPAPMRPIPRTSSNIRYT